MSAAGSRLPRWSEVGVPLGTPLPHRHRLPRAEDCDLLRVSALRLRVAPDASSHELPCGTELQLLWAPCGRGRRLLGLCPSCGARVAVLRRPPGGGWACRCCQPVSMRSHRRSGHRRGRGKPRSWALDQISDEQARCVRLLGLAQWPPPPMFWTLADLEAMPRRSDAPRLSRHRREALLHRLDALESLRVRAIAGCLSRLLGDQGRGDQGTPPAAWMRSTEAMIAATQWAVRRPASDPRTLRRQGALRPLPFEPAKSAAATAATSDWSSQRW